MNGAAKPEAMPCKALQELLSSNSSAHTRTSSVFRFTRPSVSSRVKAFRSMPAGRRASDPDRHDTAAESDPVARQASVPSMRQAIGAGELSLLLQAVQGHRPQPMVLRQLCDPGTRRGRARREQRIATITSPITSLRLNAFHSRYFLPEPAVCDQVGNIGPDAYHSSPSSVPCRVVKLSFPKHTGERALFGSDGARVCDRYSLVSQRCRLCNSLDNRDANGWTAGILMI